MSAFFLSVAHNKEGQNPTKEGHPGSRYATLKIQDCYHPQPGLLVNACQSPQRGLKAPVVFRVVHNLFFDHGLPY